MNNRKLSGTVGANDVIQQENKHSDLNTASFSVYGSMTNINSERFKNMYKFLEIYFMLMSYV